MSSSSAKTLNEIMTNTLSNASLITQANLAVMIVNKNIPASIRASNLTPDSNNEIDLSPFKVVGLQYLVIAGLYKPIAIPGHVGSASFSLPSTGIIYTPSGFTSTSQYLPVGDIFVEDASGWVQGLSNIPVLLVQNQDTFCTPITSSSLIQYTAIYSAGITSKATGNQVNVLTAHKAANGYVLLGNVTQYFTGYMAMVNPNYLIINFNQSGALIGGGGITLGKIYYGDGYYSTPFMNFRIYDDPDVKLPNFINVMTNVNTATGTSEYTPTFFDILPFQVMEKCAAGSINNSAVCAGVTSTVLNSSLQSYCVGDNLKTQTCYNYCNANGCDSALTTYCGTYSFNPSLPSDEQIAQDQTCGCHYTTAYYLDARENNLFPGVDSSTAQTINEALGDVKANCEYGGCEQGSIKIFNNPPICPTESNIQICLAQAKTNVGSATNFAVKAGQYLNCTQKSSTTTNTDVNGVPTTVTSSTDAGGAGSENGGAGSENGGSGSETSPTPTSKPSSGTKTSTYIMIGVGVLVLLIGIVAAVFFLRKKKT